ncbi:MAG: hypothetical protein IAE92_12110, partial [Burkholderiaceae bacterium]|nr:hypothetical protein [Burkholderiaceae bacterium]
MSITDSKTLYGFVLQQMAAESYFEGLQLSDSDQVKDALIRGTNRIGYQSGPPDLNEGYPGYTRMTAVMADEFLSQYKIVHQWSDNPTPTGSRPAAEGIVGKPKLNTDIMANTGFSATLIQARDANGILTGEYTLSMRSTEYRDWAAGGDGERDNKIGVTKLGSDSNSSHHTRLTAESTRSP